MNNGFIARWKKERDAAVGSLDVDVFRKFYNKYRIAGIYDIPLPQDDKTVMATMCKMALEIRLIPKEKKDAARMWLRMNGFKEGIK